MPLQPVRDLTSYVSAYAPLLAVLVAVGVGLTQLYLQSKHLSYLRYEKRYRVFQAIQRVLQDPKATSKASELLTALKKEGAEVSFLFGPEIKAFCKEVDEVLRTLGYSEERFGSIERTKEDTQEFVKAVARWSFLPGRAETLFRPYLQLYHKHCWLVRKAIAIHQWGDAREEVLIARYHQENDNAGLD